MQRKLRDAKRFPKTKYITIGGVIRARLVAHRMGMESFASGGKTIRMNVQEPAGEGPFPAILLVHGAGGNVDFWLDRIAPAVTRMGIAVYAVHYFDRTGTVRADAVAVRDETTVRAWLGTVRDAVKWVAARPKVNAKRVALLGISLGAYLSLALGAEDGTKDVRAIVDVSGGLAAPQDAMATKEFPPTLIVHGEADTVVAVSEGMRVEAVLKRLGVAHEKLLLPGEGHWFSAGAQLRILAAVAGFLGKHL